MLWASREELSPGKPAVIALGAERSGRTLRAEALLVMAPLPAGALAGTFHAGEDDPGVPMVLEWPEMPWHPRGGKLHPVEDWTPAQIRLGDRVVLRITEER